MGNSRHKKHKSSDTMHNDFHHCSLLHCIDDNIIELHYHHTEAIESSPTGSRGGFCSHLQHITSPYSFAQEVYHYQHLYEHIGYVAAGEYTGSKDSSSGEMCRGSFHVIPFCGLNVGSSLITHTNRL